MFIVTIYKTRIGQYASGSDKVGEQFAAIAQRLPRSGFLRVPGGRRGDGSQPSQGRSRQQGQAERATLVRPSLRAIDQEFTDVQRGERIWVPSCGVGSPSRLEMRCSLTTQVTNSTLWYCIASHFARSIVHYCAMTETDGGN